MKREEIECAVKDVFKDIHCDFILLFGSAAEGKMHAMSDIDIGISAARPFDLLTLGYAAAMLERALGRRIDLLDLHGLYQKKPLLAFNILKNHKAIDVHDKARYDHFKTMCQLSYLDHLPLIEMNRRQLEKRIESGRVGERNYG